jgi:hypothetical protein
LQWVGLELLNLDLPWFAGLSSYPLDHEVFVERIILELPDKLRGQGILTENILYEVEESQQKIF